MQNPLALFLFLSLLLERRRRSLFLLSLSLESLLFLPAAAGDGLRRGEALRELVREGVREGVRLPEGVRLFEPRPGVILRILFPPPRPGLRPRLESRPWDVLRPRPPEGVEARSFLT